MNSLMEESARLRGQIEIINENVSEKYGSVIEEVMPMFKNDYAKLKGDI